MNIDHQLQRTVQEEYIIEETKTEAGRRMLPITRDVADMFRDIIKDRKLPKVEKVIDGYPGFFFFDEVEIPLVVMHLQHRFNHMIIGTIAFIECRSKYHTSCVQAYLL